MWQARAALQMAGKLAAVQAAVDSSGSAVFRSAWEYATTVQRSSPMIAALGPAVGMSDHDIDQLFIVAANLTA